MLFIWLILLSCHCKSNAFVIPTVIEGIYANENVQVVELKVGTPNEVLRLVVDGSAGQVKLATSRAAWMERSSSFSSALGGSDIVRIGGEVSLLPFTFDSSEALVLGCGDCQGVIGLGAESPLWIKYNDMATFTAGGTLVDEQLKAFTRELGGSIGKVKCMPGEKEICVAIGNFNGYAPDVTIIFGLPVKRTRLPPGVFASYIGTKNVNVQNQQSDWGDIKIRLESLPGTGKSNNIRIRNVDLVTPSKIGGVELMIESSGDPNIAIIGIQAWRSFMMRRHWSEGYAQFVNWQVRTHYTWWALILLPISAFMLFFWKITDSGGWNTQSVYKKFNWNSVSKASNEKKHRTIHNRMIKDTTERIINNIRLINEAIVLALIVIIALLPTTRESLRSHEEVWILILVITIIMLFWGFVSSAIYISILPDVFGKILISERRVKKRKKDSRKFKMMDFVKPTPSILRTTHISDSTMMNFSSKPLRFSNEQELRKRGTYLEDETPKRKNESIIRYRKTYIHPRLWVVMGVTHEIIIILLMFLLLVEGRVETLGITSVMLLSMILIADLAYHIFFVALVSTGPRLAYIWWIFIATLIAILVAFTVITDIHVVQPWVERTIHNYAEMNVVWRFGIYVFVIWVAFGFSKRAAVDHKLRLLNSANSNVNN